MPRVTLNKKKYMLSDFSEWVVGRMKKLGITQKQAGAMIGLSQSAFYQKLHQDKFTLSDVMTIFKEFYASDEEILRLMKM